MQYLDIVKAVYRKLRETEPATVSEDDYSTLIGDLVNEAKREVEDAWDWNCLRSVLPITSVASQAEYSLTGTGDRWSMYWFLDNNKDPLWKQTEYWYYRQQSTTGKPRNFVYSGCDSSGDATILLYPTPDTSGDVYNMGIKAAQADLSDDTDTLSVPSKPVILGAVLKAIEERGEDGGNTQRAAKLAYARAMSDAIALEAARFPEQTTFRVV